MTDTPTTAPELEEQIAWLRRLIRIKSPSIGPNNYNPGAVERFRDILASLERLRDIDSRAPSQPAEARPSITLNEYELLRAVESRGGIFNGYDVTIEYFGEAKDIETGEPMPAGYYIIETEYPEEGRLLLDSGKLTEDFCCIVCHVCGNQRTIGNGVTGTDPRGYSDCTNCSDHKGPPAEASPVNEAWPEGTCFLATCQPGNDEPRVPMPS